MEVSRVRQRVQAALNAARDQAQRHRQAVAATETDYARFLVDIATPLAKQVANVLKAEGYSFTVSTPGGGLRIDTERSRDDFVDIALNTDARPPEVVGRIRYTRGSRTIDDERRVKPGATPSEITEEELLEFLIRALEPWLER